MPHAPRRTAIAALTALALSLAAVTALPVAASADEGPDLSQALAITTGGSEPYGLAVTADGGHLFVGNLKSSNVQIIDTADATVADRFSLAGDTGDVAIAADGTLWVTQSGEAKVAKVVDPLSASRTISYYDVGATPSEIAFSPDGTEVYVVEGSGAKQVQQLDAGTGEVERTSAPFQNVPSGIAVDPSGDVWVGGDELVVLDPTLQTTLLSSDGFAGPPAISPDGATAYVGRASTIQAIDVSSLATVGTISAGPDPDLGGSYTALGEQITHLAVTPDGATLYATNYDYPWRARIDIAAALADDADAVTLLAGPVPGGADATDTDDWEYSNQLLVIGNALWTAVDGANYNGSAVERTPIPAAVDSLTDSAGAGDTVTIHGSGLLGATVTVDGQTVTPTLDDFATIEFTMPVLAVDGTVEVTVSTTSTATPVDAGAVNYLPGTLTSAIPTIDGTAMVGQTLTAVPGVWTDGTALAYQWYRGDAAIDGATASTLTITDSAWVGAAITVAITGTHAGYETATQTSDPVTVAAAILSIGTPRITGTATFGKTLSAGIGSWAPADVTTTIAWDADGEPIPGETGAALRLDDPALVGRTITITVAGTWTSGTQVNVTSLGVTVKAATLGTKRPTISGTVKVGRKLTAKHGTWTSGTTFAYRWYAGGKSIKGATKSTFKVTKSQRGKTIKVRITGKKSGYGTAARTSKSTKKVPR